MKSNDFDAIVVGSGITGGWAAKELTERGLRVLMLERGSNIEHGKGYKNEFKHPWEMPYRGKGDPQLFAEEYAIQSKVRHVDGFTYEHFVNDKQHPYQVAEGTEFTWHRGYQLGGRSLTWGRQSYRWGDIDFAANKKDGKGVDWPVRYRDMAPWYDHVEQFIGVSGQSEGLDQLPDGVFMKPMALNPVEIELREKLKQHHSSARLTIGRTANITEPRPGRSPCNYRSICARGCSFGAYFSTQSSTLPAALATGRLTLETNAFVERLQYDANLKKITGVDVVNTQNGKRTRYSANIVFLCAGSVNSVSLLQRSATDDAPQGLANSSGVLGRYFMDHASTLGVLAVIPGFADKYYAGNRPTGIVIPRFRNLDDTEVLPFKRGYSFQGGAYRGAWTRGKRMAGLGQSFKEDLRKPGPWMLALTSFAESIPNADNRIVQSKKRDQWGIPQVEFHFNHGENELAALKDASEHAQRFAKLLGGHVIMSSTKPNPGGSAIHEMGGARMGWDPMTSVVNKHNQCHDIDNLFIADGAAMSSSACQNPSLTYMAFTARAAAYAASQFKTGAL